MFKGRGRNTNRADETSPLLARGDRTPSPTPLQLNGAPRSPAASSLLRTLTDSEEFSKAKQTKRRWPSIAALTVLCIAIIIIIVVGFVAPTVVEKYAMQAMVFEPTSLSIESVNSNGIKARVKGLFGMDAKRVKSKSVRDLGRLATSIAVEVESGPAEVEVSLPEYGNVDLGTATVPGIKVDVRDGHHTAIDKVVTLQPGDFYGIRQVASDWIDGRLGQLRIQGRASVPLKSGLFSFGTQSISVQQLFENKDIPVMPGYKVDGISIHEIELPSYQQGVAADVSLTVKNEYPVHFTIPPMGFGILVDGCTPSDHIMVADTTTDAVMIEPYKDLQLNLTGIVRKLPEAFVTECPDQNKSPMDLLLGNYIHGEDAKLYVQGSDSPSMDTPDWVTDIVKSVTVPIPFPGHELGDLIRNFSLTDTHFGLPDPIAEPGTPEAQPKISATIRAIVNVPEEMNFNIDVSRVRADADVFYHGEKLGYLDLRKWQPANSTRIGGDGKEPAGLLIESAVDKAPLNVTNDDLFTDVVQSILFGKKIIKLNVKATVDVGIDTALGNLAVRRIPAEGVVPLKPIRRGGIGTLGLEVGSLAILDTTETTLTLTALVNFTNPTNYSANVPYVDIHILSNGTQLGHALAKNVSVNPGRNINVVIQAIWDPLGSSGSRGKVRGRELLSQYISGYNTTLTLKTHAGTVPAQPALGKALEQFELEVPTPRLRAPKNPKHGDGDDDDDDDGKGGPHFIEDATVMHLFTSTATFTLLSPLAHSTLFLDTIDATAFYKEDDVGRIVYDEPIEVPPGATETPRLPVDWSLASVGYEAVRKALGGTLKLSAKAVVDVRIGMYKQNVWFHGGQIGAKKQTPRSRSTSRRRRPTKNLNHLALAPLSTAKPLIDAAADDNDASLPRTSYIEGRSAPTTPSILSRSGSRKQLAPNSSRNLKSLGHGGYGDSKYNGTGEFDYVGDELRITTRTRDSLAEGLPKAKSSTALSPPVAATPAIGPDGKRRHHQRSRTGGSTRQELKRNDDDFLKRVGTVIASSTRDAKGQSWLVSRQSSISLVDHPNSSDDESHTPISVTSYRSRRTSRPYLDLDEELGISSPRFSRFASRDASRVHSRTQSRRQSRHGSRIEMQARTPVGTRTPLAGMASERGSYFGDVDMGDGALEEADFVDLAEEKEGEKEDEEEIARLARETGSGFGGWVDRFMGFALFNMEEDRDESADEAAEGESAEEAKRRKLAELRRKKEERERLIAQQRTNENPASGIQTPKEDHGGWQDAAWLLSVASKILI
ncbi:MAG: hypothetical protein M1820_000373 [Bogoriella megaspora]|nr:MAG: hypothetical protein M1820_000373 [Bogoriella megaspora]